MAKLFQNDLDHPTDSWSVVCPEAT